MNIENYNFEGPYTGIQNLQDRSGIYAVLDIKDNKYTIIDIGESSDVKTRIETHDRQNQWKNKCQGIIAFAAYYTLGYNQSQRKIIEQELRDKYRPTCGDR